MKKINESDRSEMVRDELRKQGFRIIWDVQEADTRVSYAHNGKGKALLVLEHAQDEKGKMSWQSWDLYRPLTTSISNAETFSALDSYTKEEGHGS